MSGFQNYSSFYLKLPCGELVIIHFNTEQFEIFNDLSFRGNIHDTAMLSLFFKLLALS